MKHSLIIDDELTIQEILKDALEQEQFNVYTADNGFDGLQIIENNNIDLVFLDIWMPEMGGIEVLDRIKKGKSDCEVIIISGQARIDMAVRAIKMGAYDFLEKPLDMERVKMKARNAFERKILRQENIQLKTALQIKSLIVGDDESVHKVRDIINQSAASEARVMILGENGTGKELVARNIHSKSRRRRKALVEVNCAAIPDTLIESELFGHEKGAFTGAVARRKGKFEMADSGTLFLDEVADLSQGAQAKLLRVLQEMSFLRVGGEEPVNVDVRVICATNKDIVGEVRAGRFREDLYFRLNVIPIVVPPLRERTGDIPLLLNHFINDFQLSSGETRQFSDEAITYLKAYSWPGNIRELKNLVERVLVMSDESVITRNTVEYYLEMEEFCSEPENYDPYLGMTLADAKQEFEKSFLRSALQRNKGNISRTARELGMYSSNLHGKINKYNIEAHI